MYKRILVGLILLWPAAGRAADPYGDGENSDRHAEALAALREKEAEAENLQIEIDRLRRLAGEPPPNVNVRVRVIEVSLTKAQNMGLSWAPAGEATLNRELFELYLHKGVARVRADEILTTSDGCEARLHVGANSTVNRAAGNERGFQGIEVRVTPKRQRDGRLVIELVSKEVHPISRSGGDDQARVHEVATAAELAPGEPIVVEGRKEHRVESSVREILFVPAFRRVTNTISEVQTFIEVSLEPRLAARTVTPARRR
jgi:hypothetical protein